MAYFDSQSQYPDPELSQLQNAAWSTHEHFQRMSREENGEYDAVHSSSPLNSYGLDHNENISTRNIVPSNRVPTIPRVEPESMNTWEQQRANGRERIEIDWLEDAEISEDNLSDASSDYQEFHAGIAKYNDEVFKLRSLTDHENEGRRPDLASLLHSDDIDIHRYHVRQRIGGPHRKGPHRGPRRAAEPTGDIKLRLAQASNAFLKEDYGEAGRIISEVIRINAETHEAWTLLAALFKERQDFDNAVKSLTYAAHLRPKHVASWLSAADCALNDTGSLRPKYLINAQFCYGAAIRADPNSLEARFGKAAVCAERGKLKVAISEYKMILSHRPHDTDILRRIAELSIDEGEVQPAIDLYKTSIHYYRSLNSNRESSFNWTDADVYITLFEYSGQYQTAINELKSVARWLLGRSPEAFWDEVISDDREWDMDDLRRAEVPSFDFGRYPVVTYGSGLPLEFRVKLGIYRLHLNQKSEAVLHLNHLDPSEKSGEQKVLQYSHLFRQAADHLYETGNYHDALLFYRPLRQIPDHVEPLLLLRMGKCCIYEGSGQQAEEFFQAVIQLDSGDIDARMELAKMYEQADKPEQAFNYINEVMLLRRSQSSFGSMKAAQNLRETLSVGVTGMSHRPAKHGLQRDKERAIPSEEALRAEHLKNQYYVLKRERDGMRAEDALSTQAWMEAARDLTNDFRGFKTFYPWDKYLRFLGYSGDARIQAETSLDSDLTAMADRLSRNLGAEISDRSKAPRIEVPEDYRGISFSTWLDVFLEYALCLARKGKARESYEICEAAKDAIVFYHSREDMFLIHVCWCLCALISNDEETCVATARFFMKDYQFTTDSYRMFAAVTRICHSPVSWYSSGPSQKYILRQIKAMDYALVDESRREKYFAEKGSYSAQDANGHLIINNDLDIALLMLYGHILFTGTSYVYALNYFFRAYALDQNNPMIHLSIGLAYIHHALKRQSENRQYNVLQGIAFMLRYYRSRILTDRVEERQEAHFNMARAYHMLGLVHLATPFYFRVLNETARTNNQLQGEGLAIDAAYNLESIYILAGNIKLAEKIASTWLKI